MTPSSCRQLDVNSRRRRRMGFDSRLTLAAAGSGSPPPPQPTPSADLNRGSNAWFAGWARARVFSGAGSEADLARGAPERADDPANDPIHKKNVRTDKHRVLVGMGGADPDTRDPTRNQYRSGETRQQNVAGRARGARGLLTLNSAQPLWSRAQRC